MKSHPLLFLPVLLSLTVPASSQQPAASVSLEGGALILSSGGNPCPPSEILVNHDYGFHCGYTWQYEGVQPPYYGAFAEGFTGDGIVCGTQLVLTTLPEAYTGQTLDAYVWDGVGEIPGAVLSVTPGLDPGPVAWYPNHSVHDFAIVETHVHGPFFAGMWPDWPGEPAGYYLAEDQDGPIAGTPMTNIAPGIGLPTGWHNVAIIWGPTYAMGIGAWFLEGGSPVESVTWSRIKSLWK